MRFSTAKHGLVEAIATVAGASESGGDDVFSAIQIEAHEVDQLVHLRAVSSAMAMATRLSALVESDGVVMVPARVLASVARVAQGTDVDVELLGSDLHFSGANGGMTCRTLMESSFPYPKLDPPEEFATVDGRTFSRAVSMATSCVVKGMTGVSYSGLRLKSDGGEVTVTGCDGNRTMRCVVGESATDYEAVLPLRGMAVAAKLAAHTESMFLGGGASRAGFRTDKYLLRCVLMEGRFPAVERILPDAPDTTAKVNISELLGAISRVKAVAKTGNADLVSVFLTTEEKGLTIGCSGGLGSVKETIPAEVTGPLVVGVQFNWTYFADIGSFIEPEEDVVIGFVAAKSNALSVRQAGWHYMAMPITLRPKT